MFKEARLTRFIKTVGAVLFTACLPAVASASIVYSNWTTNENGSGNYILTVTESAGDLGFNLTVNPWNAEALGLFIDLGDFDLPGTALLSSVVPTGQVSLYATDTLDNDCGNGCNLQGLSPTIPGDGEWELVFRLGSQGFEGIQTFSFSVDVPGIALAESQLGLVGIRAQNYCDPGGVLPNGSCGGSDKSFSTTPDDPPTNVSAPASLALLGLGLIGFVGSRRRGRKV